MTRTKKLQKVLSSYKIPEETKKCCCCLALKVSSDAFKWCYSYRLLLLLLLLLLAPQLLVVAAAPSSSSSSSSSTHDGDSTSRLIWPPMKHHDIWFAADAVSDIDASAAVASDENDAAANAVIVAGDFNAFDATITNANDLEFGISSSGSSSDIWRNNTISNGGDDGDDSNGGNNFKRRSKVIHLFPVPVDGECLSDDGRRTGTCFNAYECRLKGGMAKGECAMGFGVCCIFIANCNQTITNNITYLVSPNFPSFMPNNFSACSIKVKMLNADVSQLRIDFYHFSLGQPNRRTGNCDSDIFTVSGGPSGTFSLCGQNSGQHIYYDIGGRALPRQTLFGNLRPITYSQLYPNQRNATSSNEATEQELEITMNFAQRFLPIRLWEIRIAQIPFSQRAPAGCLQYFTGTEGILQTFNFAENGRHLANQHYRICMRQETEMCSIMYQTCDEQSFRIGPSAPIRTTAAGQPENQIFQGAGATTPMNAAATTAVGTGAVTMGNIGTMEQTTTTSTTTTLGPLTMRNLTTVVPTMSTGTTTTMAAAMPTTSTTQVPTTTTTTVIATSATRPPTTAAAPAATEATTAAAPAADDPNPPPSDSPAPRPSTTPPPVSTTSPTSTAPLNDEIEGSGGGDDLATPSNFLASRRPRPVSGGFDILGFLRNALDFRFRRRSARNMPDGSEYLEQQRQNRQQRQFFSSCTDRITMPCIIEDFIGAGAGFGPLPGCEPVHCGAQFCSSGMNPCRIESTVTPFYIGVHFGDGIGKGSAEDNIGMCLRYTQVQCM